MSLRRPTRRGRRSPSPTTGSPAVAAAAAAAARWSCGVEQLETRRMLTTLVSTPATGPGEFTYVVDGSHAYEINYNNVSLEAIASLVDTTTGQEGVGDLQQAAITTPDVVESALYKLYVTSATAGSYISVLELDPVTGNLVPFGGGVGGFNASSPAGPVVTPVLPGGTGSVLIGGVSVVTDMLIPQLQLFQSIGLQPAPAGGELTPGIQVLAVDPATGLQNDLGTIAIGGTVTGTVSIGGNIGEFYAGGVLTGAVDGGGYETGTTATPALANFTVGGDLGQFVSLGPVGTDQFTPGVIPQNPIDNADYLTDFVLSVGGTVGSIQVGNAESGQASRLYGAVLVANDTAVARQTAPVITTANPFQVLGSLAPAVEVENVSQTPAGEETPGELGQFLGAVVNLRNNEQYYPGSFGAAQVVGSSDLGGVPADVQMLGVQPVLGDVTGLPTKDESGNIKYQAAVTGTLQGGIGDTSDFYGLGLRAGETVTLTLAGAPTLEVFDPDGREVATNFLSGATALQFTPDRPGIYTFDVTEPTPGNVGYEFLVGGLPDTAIGGISVAGIYDDIGFDGAITAGRGDLGAIAVGHTLASLTTGPTPNPDATVPAQAPSTIVVATGSLNAVVAGAFGRRSTGNQAVLQSGPYLNVPAGDVGLLRATGNTTSPFSDILGIADLDGVMNVHSRFDPNYLNLATPQFVADDADGWAVGGSIQTIDVASTYEGELAANRGIGTLRATDLATDTPSYFDVNADNAGQDGVIDLIDVTGSFGDGIGGGPGFVTHDGGDIRYLHLTGTIFVDSQFGGQVAPTITYPISQVVTFTDDAGNSVSLTPVGQVQNSTGTIITGSPITSAPTPQQTSDLIAGPQIQLVTYPVRDKAGLVPVSVLSTGGLVVTGNGTSGSSSQVEIATIVVQGLGRDVVRTGLTDAFGNATIFQPDPAALTTAELANNGAIAGGPADDGASTNSIADINTGSLNTSTGTSTGTGSTSTTGNGNGTTGSSGSPNPTGGSLGTSGSIEPGASDIDVSAVGGTSTLDTAEGNATDLIVILQGSATVSTFSLTTSSSAVTIADTTPGEIVNLTAPGVGSLQVRGNLGFATGKATVAAVYPSVVIPNGNTYPFVEQATGVVIGTGFLDPTTDAVNTATGYAVDVRVGGAVANFQAGLTVQSMVANADGTSTPGQADGIDGPVVVGRLLTVDVGQGVLPTGTGSVGLSGIFATFKVGVVDNYGNPNGDIRGNIISAEYDEVTNVGIDSVQVRNASVIGSTIETIQAPLQSRVPFSALPFGQTFADTDDVSTVGFAVAQNNAGEASFLNPYVFDVGSIAVVGDGGIIGSRVNAQGLGPVLVAGGGFGILESFLDAGSGGRIASVVSSGYGIRDTTIRAGAYLGPVTASGSGALVPTTAYPIDVRPSDDGNGSTTFDPFFGISPDAQIDLNAALQTSKQFPNIPNVTDTGIVQDDTIQVSSDFAGLAAHIARTALALFNANDILPLPQVDNIPTPGVTFANSVTVGGTIGYVRIFAAIDGLQVTAGRVKLLRLSNNLNRIGLAVAGPIDNLTVNGNVGQLAEDFSTGQIVPDSYIDATGPSGRIGHLLVRGSLFANLRADASIGTATILGDVKGSILVEGQTTGIALGTLRVSGTITGGALNVTGRVGSIITNGSLGAAGDTLTINGSVNLISVGAARTLKGSVLALGLTVNGSLNTLRVDGSVTGNVAVTGDLHNLDIADDGTAAAALSSTVTVGGRLFNVNITNGSVSGTIDANLDLFNFNLTGGSLDASGVIRDDLAAIHSLRIAGGATDGLYGTVSAPSGNGLRLAVSGNVGDGVNPASVSALSGTSVTIGGSVQPGATISLAGKLQSLVVGGNVAAGAVVSANPLVSRRVRGTDASA